VTEDLLESLASLETMDPPEGLENLVLRACQAGMDVTVLMELLVSPVFLDLLVFPVSPDPQVFLVLKVNLLLDSLELLVRKVTAVWLVFLVCLVPQVEMDSLERKETEVIWDPQVHAVLLVNKVFLVTPELAVSVLRVILVIKDLKVHKVPQVQYPLLVPRVLS